VNQTQIDASQPERHPSPMPRVNLRRREEPLAGLVDWTTARLGRARPVVLVSGFWRSGTTWLQELLAAGIGAKTVFEPLSPQNARRSDMLQRAGIARHDVREALIPGPAAPTDPMWRYLDAAFSGAYGSNFTRACRQSVRESLLTTIVVKDVRLQFNLDRAHERYRLPVIHIRRHPGAAIASLLAQRWTWSLRDVSLHDLVPDRFAELAAFDGDAISRLAAYWAVTEKYVDATLEKRAWATTVTYEDAVAAPGPVVSTLCDFIGRTQTKIPDFHAPSASHFGQADLAFAARPDRWKETLGAADIERIRSIVATIYPEYPFDRK
jgi:hypothetical protein